MDHHYQLVPRPALSVASPPAAQIPEIQKHLRTRAETPVRLRVLAHPSDVEDWQALCYRSSQHSEKFSVVVRIAHFNRSVPKVLIAGDTCLDHT